MIDNYQVIMITGPRQVEESTLLNYISRKLDRSINKVTLDDLILRNQAQEDPELYTTDKKVEQYYSDYLRTFIEKDIRKFVNNKDENKFIKFVSSLAARAGQEFVATTVASEVGIDDKAASSWLTILKNTEIIYLLQPYMNNSVGRAIKREKIYFTDTGFACYLAGYVDHITLEKNAYSGSIFETYVVDEIIKSFANYEKDAIKNFDVANNFEQNKGNGIVLCMAKDIISYDNENYMVPIEYI